jgi:hypothetical protein
MQALQPGDQRPGNWAATHASLDNPATVGMLLLALRAAGAEGQVTTLLDRDPATHASLDRPAAVARLLYALRKAGADGQAAALAKRAAAHSGLDDPGLDELLDALSKIGTGGQVSPLATRAAARASLVNPAHVSKLLRALREAKAYGQVTTLLDRDPAAHVSLDDPRSVTWLLRTAGADGQIAALASRVAAASLEHPNGMTKLLRLLREATGHIADPNDDTFLGMLPEEGTADLVTALASRAAAHASLVNPAHVAELLNTFRATGADSQVTTLVDRDPAAHVSLDNPADVASLLDALLAAKAYGQVAALLDRDPATHTAASATQTA